MKDKLYGMALFHERKQEAISQGMSMAKHVLRFTPTEAITIIDEIPGMDIVTRYRMMCKAEDGGSIGRLWGWRWATVVE
jgi:hypothetical protein